MSDWGAVGLAMSRRPDESMEVQTVTVSATNGLSWRVDLSITGSGVLHSIYWSVPKTSKLRITIDGGVCEMADIGRFAPSSGLCPVLCLGIEFKQSLEIAVADDTGSSTRATSISYSLT